MTGKQIHKGKDQRDHDRLTDRQRETIVKLHNTHGLDAVLERFGGEPWNLTANGYLSIAAAAAKAKRVAAGGGTDWRARFMESRFM